jgi:hypothetical protein
MSESVVGGYFGLELPVGRPPHTGSIALNSGRNGLRYLLTSRPPTKVHIPHFTCAAVARVIGELGIEIERYSVNEAMEPIFDFGSVKTDEAFLVTNYFGIKNNYISGLTALSCRFVIDNAQSFFSPRVENFETFYSPRKFFGVPDGGYAFGGSGCEIKLDRGHSNARMSHLLLRHDVSAQDGYGAYSVNEGLIEDASMMEMSAISARILESIDYDSVASIRKRNFQQLHEVLGPTNKIPIDDDNERVALTYPYLGESSSLRARLRAKNIFTAAYWPELLQLKGPSLMEKTYANEIVHLPIDQRYGAAEMCRILDVIDP